MVVGVIEYVKDVTERRQAEETLQRRTEQLTLLNRVIAASAASGDIRVDPGGGLPGTGARL